MGGEIMMLEGLDAAEVLEDFCVEAYAEDLGDLGAGPPALLKDIVKEIAGDPAMKVWLRKQGRIFAENAIRNVVAGWSDPPNPWIEALIDPFFGPYKEGILDVLKAKAKPLLTGVAFVMAGAGVALGMLIGGKKRRLMEHGYRQAVQQPR